MKYLKHIVLAIYLINALGMLGIGSVYQFSEEFMPYHAQVIQTPWTDLTNAQQVLYIGMMRTEAAGFLATSAALFILLFIPFRNGQYWSAYAMTAIGCIEYLPSAVATFHVYQTTGASTPWFVLFIGIGSLLLANLMSVVLIQSKKGKVTSD